MDSPPPSNLLLDPLSELTSIIQLNAFGLDLSGERTHIVLGDSFPITQEDRDRIAIASIRSGEIQDGVCAKAVLGLQGGEGEAVVVLDQRGYTVCAPFTFTFTFAAAPTQTIGQRGTVKARELADSAIAARSDIDHRHQDES